MSTPSDQIPPSPPPSPPPYEPVPPLASANDDRNLAMLTHLSGCFLSIIVPLVVWIINKDKADKAYLVTESKEALNFQVTVLIGYLICSILALILIGAFLSFLLWVVNVVFCIIAAVKVSQIGSYRYPFALRLVN
ncbi:MAG: DUF4870 domain-containing protein [Luteibacter sp.]